MAVVPDDVLANYWTSELDSTLDAALRRARWLARKDGVPAFACVSVPFVADIGAVRAAVLRDEASPFAAYWREEAGERLAFGCAADVARDGPDAMSAAQAAYEVWRTRVVCDRAARAAFFMGAAFDPVMPRQAPWTGWPGAWLVLPSYVVERTETGSTLTVAVRMDAGDEDTGMLAAVRTHFLAALSRRWVDAAADAPAGTAGEAGAAGRVPGLRNGREDGVSDGDTTHFGRTPETDRWARIVTAGAESVRTGRYGKVVLARSERERGRFDVDGVVTALAAAYPSAVTFAVRRGAQVFVGATPERLAAVRAGGLRVDCLAGSAARGTDEAKDARQAAELLSSGKNLAEHEAVVRGVLADLADATVQMEAAERPVIRTLPNLHHLFTPVSGRLAPGESALSVVRRLHPTPAVAGLPRQEAMRAIADWERMDRGWYAGPVGWLDGRGDGEFAVALRSGLLDASGAYLYAGVGVVAQSDPWDEWQETQWKLMPMRRALGAPGGTAGFAKGDEPVGVQ